MKRYFVKETRRRLQVRRRVFSCAVDIGCRAGRMGALLYGGLYGGL